VRNPASPSASPSPSEPCWPCSGEPIYREAGQGTGIGHAGNRLYAAGDPHPHYGNRAVCAHSSRPPGGDVCRICFRKGGVADERPKNRRRSIGGGIRRVAGGQTDMCSHHSRRRREFRCKAAAVAVGGRNHRFGGGREKIAGVAGAFAQSV